MTVPTKLRPTRAFARIRDRQLTLGNASFYAISDDRGIYRDPGAESVVEVYVIYAADYRALVRAAKGKAGRKGRK